MSVPPDFVPSPPGDYPYREGGAIAVRAYAKLTLEHCTIVGNSSPSGGGIHLWMAAEMTVKNTVIAGNISTVSGPPDISAVQGGSSVYSQGGFFLGNEDRTERILEPARYNRIPKHIVDRLYQDQIGTKDAPLDPMLAPLGDYGGPVPTMPPLPGSPLIDAVNTKNAPQATDARGVRRPIGKLYDIGAVEYDPEHDAESTKN